MKSQESEISELKQQIAQMTENFNNEKNLLIHQNKRMHEEKRDLINRFETTVMVCLKSIS